MALKALMLRRSIENKKAELQKLLDLDEGFKTREAELEQSIEEATEPEQQAAVEEEVNKYDEEHTAHEAAKDTLNREIEDLENQLAEAERSAEKPAIRERKKNAERKYSNMETINIRSLKMGQRVFDALPEDYRRAIVAQDDVKTFLTELRSLKGQTRGVSGAELTIPVVFLDLITQNMYRYSKLMNRVRARKVRGEARQTVAGTIPQAVWTEACGAINQLNFTFNQVTLDNYKVAGFVPVCNAILEDSDIALASYIVEMISESLGYAKDAAILYGTGNKMPLGIVTRLAQTSKPATYPVNAPEWVDVHSTNIKTIAANLTGAEFWAALNDACANTFTRYSRGRQFWAMNSKTYSKLMSKAITFTATGDVVANVYGTLPVVNGDIDILEFIPDGDIIGGYGDLYLWAQRETMTIGMDDVGRTNRILDETIFFGKERADGTPVIAGAFVAININGSTPTTTYSFPSDTANDADLQDLTIGSLTLSPAFSPENQAYTASAANNVASVAVNATPAMVAAGVSVSVTSGTTTKNVNNGGNAALAVGANTIAITVANGTAAKVYTVTVTRAGA